jgi:hypothetical protein
MQVLKQEIGQKDSDKCSAFDLTSGQFLKEALSSN